MDMTPETPAEAQLADAHGQPGRITLGDGTAPASAMPDVSVRADFLRALLLAPGGTGLRLKGAWITGKLDMQGCDCPRDITLTNCHVAEPLVLVNAALRGLHISSCHIHGIAADNARFAGSVYLRGDSRCDGEISLAGARIGGDLQLTGAEIESEGQDAVFAPSLRVDGSLYLGNYVFAEGVTSLVARGTLFFASVIVGHDVFVTNTAISLNAGVVGSVFGSTEEHGADMALSFGRARIAGILYFKDNQIGLGVVNLAGAQCARFRDEPSGPGANYPLRVDGFRYGDFSRHADTDLKARLDWLERRPEGTPFTAQPYEHLADVLRSLGHRDDADRVMIRKEQMIRAENRVTLRDRQGVTALMGSILWDRFMRYLVGYGYRPGRSVLFAILLIAAFGWFMDRTWQAGDMAPNAGPILVSQGWLDAVDSAPENPAEAWSAVGAAGQDWETFHPVAYAADVIIPLVSFGQEDAWAPSTSRSPLGRAAWWMRWFAKAIGWVVAALLAAAVTGAIRKD